MADRPEVIEEAAECSMWINSLPVQKLLSPAQSKGYGWSACLCCRAVRHAAEQRKWSSTPAAAFRKHDCTKTTPKLFSFGLRHTNWTAAESGSERKGSHGATKFRLSVFTPLLFNSAKRKLLEG